MVVQFEIINILMIFYRRKYKTKCEDQDEDRLNTSWSIRMLSLQNIK